MSQQPMSSLLHHTFTGHEGSVFGVRISEEISIPGSDTVRRILASCSDDRTIRIWDVSDITNESPVGGQEDAATASVETGFATSTSRAGQDPNRYIAVAMGHLSRIWGLRFLAQQGSTQQLLSYGEDASLQVWELDVVNLARPPGTVPEDPFLALRHQDTYRFHSGKHIWSVAVLGTDDGPSKVSTGGADGCIACYDIALNEMQDRRISLWSMKGVWDKCDVQDKWPHANATSTVARSPTESPAKSTFTALKGRWVLQRTIESALSWHPSGAFKGSAVFELRPPTNKAYDMEYLYVEEGNFTTKQGLSFLGSRRYVYRYQASTDKITAWFVNVDDKTSVDYFFHDIYFQKVKVADPQFEGWQAGSSIAKGYHLCVKDDYWAEYEFKYSGAGLRKWNLAYNVKGPEKDYVANAHYTRDDNAVEAIDGVCEGLPPHAMATEGQRPDLDPQDSFKSYAWVSDVEFLTTTEYGHVLLGTLHSANQLPTLRLVDQHTFQRVSWEKLTRLDNLKSYCIAASVSGKGIAFLSGSEGTIYLYRHRERSISPLITLPLKVSGLFVQVLRQMTDPFEQVPQLASTGVVASCLGFATANALILELTPSRTEEPQFAIVRRMTLILPSSFVVTSACFTDSQKLVILGARSGALAFYDISASSDNNIGMTASCC
ncbi:hypothetical protein MMC08_004325, partial [Hypocenomyce scalaris]|nr:hypothetical protein [Hypocenomyce scalaris]